MMESEIVNTESLDQWQIFNKVYKELDWAKDQSESVSGTGSTLESTESLREVLPDICKKYEINNIVDIACGDFNWMKEIVHSFKFYRGVDIVEDLIKENKEKYGKLDNVEFIVCDVIEDFNSCIADKDFDAIILKDVLVHFPDEYVKKVLDSLKSSSIKYVFITHFTSNENNYDIKEFNGWRPQNFTISPWEWDNPIESIFSPTEKYTWDGKINNDKTLSLWELKK